MNSPYARSNDDHTSFELELTVRGSPTCCCNRFQCSLTLAATLCAGAAASSWYFLLVEGTPLWELAFESALGFFVCLIVVSGSSYFVVRANNTSMRVDFGPCSAYQRCLCCGCCIPRSRGETSFEAITAVQLIPRSQCLDGCGITENRCNNVWVMNLGCCVPSVLITRRYDPTQGCCAYTNFMIGFDTVEQAQELVSFLTEKISDVEVGRQLGTNEGTKPATAPSKIQVGP